MGSGQGDHARSLRAAASVPGLAGADGAGRGRHGQAGGELAELGDNSIIKVPIGGYRAINPSADPFTGLKVIRRLWERGIKVNTTLIFNTTQALWAANAGATYVSPFLGRLADYGYKQDKHERTPANSLYWVEDHKNAKGDQNMHNTEYVASGGPLKDAGARLIFEIATVFANYQITTEILAASFRNPVQLTECLLAGADILTVPASVLATVADHPAQRRRDEGASSRIRRRSESSARPMAQKTIGTAWPRLTAAQCGPRKPRVPLRPHCFSKARALAIVCDVPQVRVSR